MLKTPEHKKREKSHITEYANDAVRFVRGRKIKKFDFQKNIPFLAISKLRLSTYLCTPSGNPKQKFWLSLPIPKLFSYPLEKMGCLKSQPTS